MGEGGAHGGGGGSTAMQQQGLQPRVREAGRGLPCTWRSIALACNTIGLACMRLVACACSCLCIMIAPEPRRGAYAWGGS